MSAVKTERVVQAVAMPTSVPRPRWLIGIAAPPTAAFILGFGAEAASLFGDPWLGVVAVFVPLVLLLTAALAASAGEKATFVTALILGPVVGCLTAVMLVLGAFMPFALELGERDLIEVGGDLAWKAAMVWALIIYGAGGAVLGAACGAAAWVLRLPFRRNRLSGERDTRGTIR